MKFVSKFFTAVVFAAALSAVRGGDGYSDGSKHDTENAISEIENHLHAIENDQSLPSSEEQSAYKSHFASHQNSLDSVSDFAYGREGEAHHSSQINPSESEHSHEQHAHHAHPSGSPNQTRTTTWLAKTSGTTFWTR